MKTFLPGTFFDATARLLGRLADIVPFPVPVSGGGDPGGLPEHAAEIILILKAAVPGDFADGKLCVLEQLLGFLDPQIG